VRSLTCGNDNFYELMLYRSHVIDVDENTRVGEYEEEKLYKIKLLDGT